MITENAVQPLVAKYLDVPAFERDDLFYFQNLIALLEALTNRLSG